MISFLTFSPDSKEIQMKILKIQLIIILFLIFISDTSIASINQTNNYFLYFDFSKCSGCEFSLLQSYISNFKNLGLESNFNLVTKTRKSKEFEYFKKMHNIKFIINDTLDEYLTYIDKHTIPCFFVLNSEDKLVYLKENVKENIVNILEITNNFKNINLDSFEYYKLIDNEVNLFKPVPPLLSRNKDKFLVLDKLDMLIKEYDIKTGKLLRAIDVDSTLAYVFIKDSLDYYKSKLFDTQIKTKFLNANYDLNDNIIVTANAFNGFSNDLPVQKIQNKQITLSFDNNNNYTLLPLNDSLYITEILNVHDRMLSLVSYRKSRFDDLSSGNYCMVVSLDPTNYNITNHYLNYRDVIKYYGLNHYINSIGLIAGLNTQEYLYLNPWNGIFCKFGDKVLDSIKIQGYLEMMKSSSTSSLKKPVSKLGYDYRIMSVSSVNNKSIVFVNAYDTSNLITFSVLQVYDPELGIQKEIVLNSSSVKYFRSYLLNVENDFVYILSQDELENWRIIKIPSKEII